MRDRWALAADTVTYIPKGFGSYHWSADVAGEPTYFLTIDDLDNKPWLGHDREAAFAGMRCAFETAAALPNVAQLEFVVAPIPTAEGQSVVRLSPRYSLAVFQHLDAAAGTWADEMPPADQAERLRLLAELHAATGAVRSIAPRRPVDLAGRAALDAALGDREHPWTGGPFAEPARHILNANLGTLTTRLAEFDDLNAHVQRQPDSALVITHGEPHPGNLIRVDGQLRLIDWDTVALAMPERDLWAFDDGTPESLQSYIEATGRNVDTRALTFFRIAWDLEDIAASLVVFRAPHTRNADTEKAWAGFPGLLGV